MFLHSNSTCKPYTPNYTWIWQIKCKTLLSCVFCLFSVTSTLELYNDSIGLLELLYSRIWNLKQSETNLNYIFELYIAPGPLLFQISLDRDWWALLLIFSHILHNMYFLPFDLTIIIGITRMDLLTKPMATLSFADKNPLVWESVNNCLWTFKLS